MSKPWRPSLTLQTEIDRLIDICLRHPVREEEEGGAEGF